MKKSMLKVLPVALVLLYSCGSSPKETDSKEVAKEQNEQKFDDTPKEDDANFVVKAADAGMMEVEASKLALTNAASAKVKEFAQMMVDDHSKANSELMAAAKAKNITVPATISDKKKEKYNELAQKKGNDFDKDYMSMMVDAHQDAVDLFKKQAEDGKDADLKQWANGKIATLENHLTTAKNIKDAVK